MKKLTKKQIFDLQVVYNYKDVTQHPNMEWWYNKHYWWNISKKYRLSDEFIREFKDYVIWYFISKYGDLNEDFVYEFRTRISWFEFYQSQEDLAKKFYRIKNEFSE